MTLHRVPVAKPEPRVEWIRAIFRAILRGVSLPEYDVPEYDSHSWNLQCVGMTDAASLRRIANSIARMNVGTTWMAGRESSGPLRGWNHEIGYGSC